MRYAIGLGVSMLLIGAVWTAQAAMHVTALALIREQLHQSKDAGAPELANIDPETFEFGDVGTELPVNAKLLIGLADAIAGLWFIWIPFTIVLCLVVAHFLPVRGKPSSPLVPSSAEHQSEKG